MQWFLFMIRAVVADWQILAAMNPSWMWIALGGTTCNMRLDILSIYGTAMVVSFQPTQPSWHLPMFPEEVCGLMILCRCFSKNPTSITMKCLPITVVGEHAVLGYHRPLIFLQFMITKFSGGHPGVSHNCKKPSWVPLADLSVWCSWYWSLSLSQSFGRL